MPMLVDLARLTAATTTPLVASAHAAGTANGAVVRSPTPDPTAVATELLPIIRRYSIMRTWHQFSLIPELERLGLFVREGEVSTPAAPFAQSVDAYVASFHARSSLARHRIGEAAADAFDRELRALFETRRRRSPLLLGRPPRPHRDPRAAE